MKVKHLWTTGSYDGMMTGVGRLEDGRPVFLDATDCWGGHQKKERWQLLENLLDELLDDNESENIWDRIERAHEDEMYEYAKRRFKVIELTQEQFEELAHKKKTGAHRGETPTGAVLGVVGRADIEKYDPTNSEVSDHMSETDLNNYGH